MLTSQQSKRFVLTLIFFALLIPITLFFYGWYNWDENKIETELIDFENPTPRFKTHFDSNYFVVANDNGENDSGVQEIQFASKNKKNHITFYFSPVFQSEEAVVNYLIKNKDWNIDDFVDRSIYKNDWLIVKKSIVIDGETRGGVAIGKYGNYFFGVLSFFEKQGKRIFLQKESDIFYHLYFYNQNL